MGEGADPDDKDDDDDISDSFPLVASAPVVAASIHNRPPDDDDDDDEYHPIFASAPVATATDDNDASAPVATATDDTWATEVEKYIADKWYFYLVPRRIPHEIMCLHCMSTFKVQSLNSLKELNKHRITYKHRKKMHHWSLR